MIKTQPDKNLKFPKFVGFPIGVKGKTTYVDLNKSTDFVYCSVEIEMGNKCTEQYDYCKKYFAPLEEERKQEQITKELRENFH
ncbi:MAG: hypothetical protein J0M18_14070 [Ignavibacteria bacterium]|nr:hypothetical protein [Ignavibacteria bacterium]